MSGKPYTNIIWQEGTIKEAGVNGCQVEDVLEECRARLSDLSNRLPCRENSLALTKIQEAILWLNERTRERKSRGVEGTHSG